MRRPQISNPDPSIQNSLTKNDSKSVQKYVSDFFTFHRDVKGPLWWKPVENNLLSKNRTEKNIICQFFWEKCPKHVSASMYTYQLLLNA